MENATTNDDAAQPELAAPSGAEFSPARHAESVTVRSIYLYGVLAVALAAIVVGAAMSAMSLFRVIAPDAGHRDTLDRASVGVADIVDQVAGRWLDDGSGQVPSIEEYCAGWPGDDASVGEQMGVAADCAADYQAFIDQVDGAASTSPAQVVSAVTGAVRDEVNSQIRWTAFGKLVEGIAVGIAGLIVFRRHRPLVEAYR